MKVFVPMRVSRGWFRLWGRLYERRFVIPRYDGKFEHHYRLGRGVLRKFPKLIYFISRRYDYLY